MGCATGDVGETMSPTFGTRAGYRWYRGAVQWKWSCFYSRQCLFSTEV